jgi:hypothetical protein
LDRSDEAGNGGNQAIELISSIDFQIFHGVLASVLRINDGGRGSRRVLHVLAEKLGFGFSIDRIDALDGERIIGFEGADFDDCKMVSLKVTNVKVADGIIARMEFASRMGMSLPDLDDLRSREYRVESVKYEVVKAGLRGSIAATSTGRVIISGSLAPMLTDALERAMRPS